MKSVKSSRNKGAVYDFRRCLSSLWLFPTVAMLVFGKVCFEDPMYDAASWGDYKYVILGEMHSTEFFMFALLYLACGALTAIHAFSFLFSGKQCNVFLSLPLSRKELYVNRVKASMPFMVMSTVLPMAVTYIGNKLNYTITVEYIIAMVYIALALLSVMLLGFGIGSVFAVSVGNVFEATAYSALGIFLPTAVFYSLNEIMCNAVNGAPFSPVWYGRFGSYCRNISDMLEPANPIYSFFTAVHKVAGQFKDSEPARPGAEDFIPMIAWFVCFAFLAVLAQKLFMKRKAEIVGSFGGGKPAVIFAAAVISLAAFAAATMLMRSSRITAYILCVILPGLIYIGVVAAVFRNKDDIRKNLKGMAVAAAISCCLLVLCGTEFFGFYSAVPEKANVESVIVCPAASDNIFKIDDYNDYLNYSPCLYGELTSEKDISFALELHKKTVKGLGKGDNNIGIIYKLKDGRHIVRYYRCVSDEAARESLNIVETEWYRETVYDMFTNEDYNSEDAYNQLGDGDFSAVTFESCEFDRKTRLIQLRERYAEFPMIICNSTVTKGELLDKIIGEDKISEFKKILAKDLTSLSAQEIFYPQEKISFYLTLTYEFHEKEDELSFAGSFFIPLYPSMKNTLDFLSEYKIELENLSVEDIKEVVTVPFEKVVENDDFANTSVNYAVDKKVMVSWSEGVDFDIYNNSFTKENKRDMTVYSDKESVEKLFNSFKGAYAAIGNKGSMARFVLDDNSFFYAYIPAE